MEVGVYGLGRFGMLWARVLATRFTVKAYNRSPKGELPEGIAVVSFDELCRCRTIFLCVAISSMPEVLSALAGRVAPGTLVVDTCSVKVLPVRQMLDLLPANVAVLGTHPMFGPDSIRGMTSEAVDVRGLPIIVCAARADAQTEQYWVDAFTAFGLAVHQMSADAHDREAAFTQGITHFIGRVMKDLQLKSSPIATLGYRRLLEVMEQTCNDPWQLFMDLQRLNPHTVEMRRSLSRSIRRIMDYFPDDKPGGADGTEPSP